MMNEMIEHDYLTFAESIDVIIERLDGTKYSLKDYGIGVRDFAVSSPYYVNSYESIDGMDGQLDNGTTLGYRNIKMSLYFVADGVENYARKRDEVFLIFDSRQPFYVTESRNKGRRWKVKIDANFTPEQARIFGFFDINLISASPFAESPGTTLNPMSEDYLFAVGEGKIQPGDPPIQYIFNSNSFYVFNDSDVPVVPRQMEQIITLQGTLTNPSIQNLTTGDVWSWTGTAGPADKIELNGIRSLKNGASIFGQTNKKLITLAPGWNEFQINGATNPIISFDFKFYYL